MRILTEIAQLLREAMFGRIGNGGRLEGRAAFELVDRTGALKGRCESDPLAPGNEFIPTGDAAADQDFIEQQLEDFGVCVLADGFSYPLVRQLVMPMGARLLCSGLAELTTAAAFPATSVDDRTGSMIRCAGQVVPGVDTTLSATFLAGQGVGVEPLTLTSNVGLGAGKWLQIQGLNTVADAEVATELVQEFFNIGTAVTLTQPLIQSHLSGSTVKTYAPYFGNPTYPTIEGVYLNPSKTVAVGVEVTGAIGVVLKRVSGRNFTRSLIDFSGVRDFQIIEPVSRGDCNSTMLFASACVGTIVNAQCGTGEGGRTNALGIPRGHLVRDECCTQVTAYASKFRHVAGCVVDWGGFSNGIFGIAAEDIDCTDIDTRNPVYTGAHFGMVIDGGPGPIEIAAFGYGNTYDDVSATNWRGPDGFRHAAIYAHDQWISAYSNVSLVNVGHSYSTMGTDRISGIIVSDSGAEMVNVLLRGVYIGVHLRNIGGVSFVNLQMNAGAGIDAASGPVGFYLTHIGAGIDQGLKINGAGIFNFASPFYFDGDFLVTPSKGIRLHNLVTDYGFFPTVAFFSCLAADSPTGGTIMRLDPTGAGMGGADVRIEITGPNRSNVIATQPKVNGFVPCGIDGGMANTSGAGLFAGQFLEANNAGQLVAAATPPVYGTSLFRVINIPAAPANVANVQRAV